MDGRGGCCIARYATGAYDMSKVDTIMLRFRPIAPKPVPGGAASDGSSSESNDAFTRGGRTKRKYVRDNNTNKRSNNQGIRRRRNLPSQEQTHPAPVVTLSLLPETPDPKNSPARDLNNSNNANRNAPVWPSFENNDSAAAAKVVPYCYCGADQAAARLQGGSYSCVTVECVMDTWVEGEGLGSTDEERRVKLRKDTCPGFISDCYGRVTWTNRAYREMVGQGRGREGDEFGGGIVVLLVAMQVSAVVPSYPSFTCRVRVQCYACGKERNSLTVPCDVWRMDSGGFAWRLDVKAALSLSFGLLIK